MRFIRGHAHGGKVLSAEQRAILLAARLGKKNSPEHRRKISEAQLGEKGPNWRGGRIVREGRELQYVGREHPMADTYGYAYTHRLVMARHLDRPLLSVEHVHHMDLDPTNNTPDNLVLVTGGQHRRIHNLIKNKGYSPEDAVAAVLST